MNRRLRARYVAPAAFLVAVTGVVLLVRSSLRPNAPATPAPPVLVTTTAAPASTRPARPRQPKQYYVIKSGDTLDAIAAQYATTVDRLLLLNPGIQPTALTPGEQVRIK